MASLKAGLVAIEAPAWPVTLDLRYATADNLTGAPIYRRAACYLNEEAAELLARAIALAAQMDLHFRLFDGFRPTEAAWALWNHTPDPNFLADPRKGSPHSRGAAIDLTLVGADGNDLDMGTGFDAFTPRAHHGNLDITPAQQRNRALLLGIMTAAGWDFYRNEWWHYQLFDPRRYPLLSDAEAGTSLM